MAFFENLPFDPYSLAPALLGAGLSIYNWLKFSKPADIYPGEIINYGYLQSSYNKSRQLCIPIMLFNEGAHPGLVTDIKIGFKVDGKTEYLTLVGRAELAKVSVPQSRSFDWEKFMNSGYQLIQPPYPIIVEAIETTYVNMISFAPEAKGVIPINKESLCVIEVTFDQNKTNRIEFPFFISIEKSNTDNKLRWYKPIEQ